MKRFISDLKLSGETGKRSMNIYIYIYIYEYNIIYIYDQMLLT